MYFYDSSSHIKRMFPSPPACNITSLFYIPEGFFSVFYAIVCNSQYGTSFWAGCVRKLTTIISLRMFNLTIGPVVLYCGVAATETNSTASNSHRQVIGVVQVLHRKFVYSLHSLKFIFKASPKSLPLFVQLKSMLCCGFPILVLFFNTVLHVTCMIAM